MSPLKRFNCLQIPACYDTACKTKQMSTMSASHERVALLCSRALMLVIIPHAVVPTGGTIKNTCKSRVFINFGSHDVRVYERVWGIYI